MTGPLTSALLRSLVLQGQSNSDDDLRGPSETGPTLHAGALGHQVWHPSCYTCGGCGEPTEPEHDRASSQSLSFS